MDGYKQMSSAIIIIYFITLFHITLDKQTVCMYNVHVSLFPVLARFLFSYQATCLPQPFPAISENWTEAAEILIFVGTIGWQFKHEKVIRYYF